MHFHIISLFPESVRRYLDESILGRAQQSGHIKISFYNPIDYITETSSNNLKKRVDDKPYGGGPGMVIKAQPVLAAIAKAVGRKKNVEIIHFAPRAKMFTTNEAKKIVNQYKAKKVKHMVFVCGRYEGIDSRVEKIYKGSRYSIGEYVLTGGELPALVMIDSISRQIPGVLGDPDSLEEERVAAGEYYTRPETLTYKGKKYGVPSVLLSGNHKDIDDWREKH